MSDDGWWMFTMTSFALNVCSFKSVITISESADERPEVGSSAMSTEGSRMSSSAMLRRLRCPPEINLLRGPPTFRLRISYKSISTRILLTDSLICSSVNLSKQSLALKYRF